MSESSLCTLSGLIQHCIVRLFSKRNMSYDSRGDMFDLAKLVSDIYVCGNFHCCIIFLSPAPIHPGYYIRIVDFQCR